MPIYDIYRKVIFQMKIAVTSLIVLVLFLPNTFAQEYTRWSLPEGAIVRLDKGSTLINHWINLRGE